jgi:hypothetical protein
VGVAVVVPRDPAHPPTVDDLRRQGAESLASDLFVNGELIIDPDQLNLGDDYAEMLQNLNELIQSGNINEYVLDFILSPQFEDEMTDLKVDIVFSFKFSFRTCVDVPVGTNARDCQ